MIRPSSARWSLTLALAGVISVLNPSRCVASGAFTGLVFPDPILTDMEAQKIHARLITFQGVADTSFARVQRQSDPRQPVAEEVLAVFQDGRS